MVDPSLRRRLPACLYRKRSEHHTGILLIFLHLLLFGRDDFEVRVVLIFPVDSKALTPLSWTPTCAVLKLDVRGKQNPTQNVSPAPVPLHFHDLLMPGFNGLIGCPGINKRMV